MSLVSLASGSERDISSKQPQCSIKLNIFTLTKHHVTTASSLMRRPCCCVAKSENEKTNKSGNSEKENDQPSQLTSTDNSKDWLKPLFSISRVIPVRPTNLGKREPDVVEEEEQVNAFNDLAKNNRQRVTEECQAEDSASEENPHNGLNSPTVKVVCSNCSNRKSEKQFHARSIDCSSISLDVKDSKADQLDSTTKENADEYKCKDRSTSPSSRSSSVDNTTYLSRQYRDEKEVHARDKKDSLSDYAIVGRETVLPTVSSKERKQRKWSLDAIMSVTNSSRRRDSADGNIKTMAGSPKQEKNSPAQSPGRAGRKQFTAGSYTPTTSQLTALTKRRESKDGLLKRVDSKGELSPMSLRLRRRANSVDPTWQLRAQELRSSRSSSVPELGGNGNKPQNTEEHKRRSSSVDRVMRDYRLSRRELKALRCILNKVDLYDDDVRNALKPILSGSTPIISEEGDDEDSESLSDTIIKDAEKESLKQKLFMSRKELDSYIAFTRKMEKEKKQTNSEKEELRTRVQWLEKRLTLMESESKALKIERAEFLNQIYRLRCPANVPINERASSGRLSVLSNDASDEVEVSKQRLKYEADAFASERAKMIKERQRLDEEVRKVQIRCVSLLAQLQHAEKTIDDLQLEKEALKSKLGKSSQQLNDDTKSLQEQLKRFEDVLVDGKPEFSSADKDDLEMRLVTLFEFVKQTQVTKAELESQAFALEDQLEEARREIRELREEKLTLDTEVMALRTDLEGVTDARNEAELHLSEVETAKLQLVSENKSLVEAISRYKEEREKFAAEIDRLSDRVMTTEQERVTMEVDHDVFENFLEMLSLELEEKFGEEHVTLDAEASSLKEKAEVVGRQIRAHLAPARKLQDDYDDIKEELEDLRKENDALKYAMSCRVQIANIQQQVMPCNCKHEKEVLEREIDEMTIRLETLESEVNRLHQDKQSLLMSLMNLQAASRSREPSNADLSEGSETEGNDEEDDDEEDEDEEDDYFETDEEAKDSIRPLALPPSKKNQEVKVVLKYEDSTDSERAHSDEEAKCKRKLAKTLSLPNALARPSRSAENIHEYKHSDNLVQDLDNQLKEMTKTKEKLEEERAGMLDALITQVEQVEELKAEVDRLQQALAEGAQDDSFSSQTCSQCAKSTTEIGHYLKIIEDLTEDKLRLEKLLGDVKRDKEKLIKDLEAETEEKFVLKGKLEKAAKDRDDALNTAREEVDYLLQSLENLQQDNSSLEDHLQRIRQDKVELLNTLKSAEEDKLRLVQSLQSLSDTKDIQDAEEGKKAARREEDGRRHMDTSSKEAVRTQSPECAKANRGFITKTHRAQGKPDVPGLLAKIRNLEDSASHYIERNDELAHTINVFKRLLAEYAEEESKNQREKPAKMSPGTDKMVSALDKKTEAPALQSSYLKIREGPVKGERRSEYLNAADLNGNNLGSKTLCFQISFNGIRLAEPSQMRVFK